MNIDEIRANANPVENGDLDAFINQWGFPLQVEIKRDGERFWIYKNQDYLNPGPIFGFNKHNTFFYFDTHKDLYNQYRNIADSFLLEGELCTKNGQLYSYLSNRNSGKDLVFYPFDILEINGRDFRREPLSERTSLLIDLGVPDLPYAIVHKKEDILAAFDYITKEQGQEGIVIKSPKQRYGEGYWLKMKREYTIDAAIMGIKKAEHYLLDNLARSYRLGLRDDSNPNLKNKWIWIGDCGSGLAIYEKEVLTQLLEATKVGEDKDYIYTDGRYVVEISCDSKSEEGRLISPRIKRIRDDKSPESCLYSQMNNLPVRL